MSSSTSSSRALPVALGLILAIELVAWFARGAPDERVEPFYGSGVRPTVEESIVQWQVTHLMEMRDRPDVVFVGDSACLMGLRPRQFEQEHGKSAWNLGTLGWVSTDGHVDLLERLIAQVGPPEAVVYAVSYHPLTLSKGQVSHYGWLKNLRGWLKKWDTRGQGAFPPSRQLGKQWRRGFDARMREWAGLNKPLALARGVFPSDLEVREILLERRGALTDPHPPYSGGLIGVEGSFGDGARSGVQRLLALSEAKGFRLMFILSPLPESARTPRTKTSIAAIEKGLRAEVGQRATVHAPLQRYFPDALCVSKTHLTEDGAARNTREVGRAVMALLGR